MPVPSIFNISHFRGLGAIALAGLGLCIPTLATADPDKAQYELQERCGLRADQRFKADYGNGITNTKDGQLINTFRNHYNPHLNKCFTLVRTTGVNNKKTATGTVSSTKMELLFDLNDNNEYGEFDQVDAKILSCYIQDRQCSSYAEWQALIKPFLDQ
jgi:hypothetical protein